MEIGRAQIQVFMMRAATASFVMAICEQHCATDVYEQSNACDTDRFIEMNFERHKEPMHVSTGHQERHDREHHSAREPAKHTNFPGAETEARVAGLRPCEIVRDGSD